MLGAGDMTILITVGYLLAIMLPFLLVRKWKGGGFVLAVLVQWAAVHALNLLDLRFDPERVDYIFAGLWEAIGWLYAIVYCLIVLGIITVWRVVRRIVMTRTQTTEGTQPAPGHVR